MKSEFYIGQRLTVRCKHSEIPIQEGTHWELQLWIGGLFYIRCVRDSEGPWQSYSWNGHPGSVNYTALTNEACNLPEKDNTMSVTFIITEGLKNLSIVCFDPQTEEYSDSDLVIKETKCEFTLINIQSLFSCTRLTCQPAARHPTGRAKRGPEGL